MIVGQYAAIVIAYNVADKFFGSAYVIVMSDRGLRTAEIGIVLALGSLALGVLDYLGGNLADTLGRRRVMALGFLVWGLSLLAYAASETFVQFSLAMCGWAIGIALILGAPQAWFVDSLASVGSPEKKQAVLPSVQSAALAIAAVAALTSGWLIHWRITLPAVVAGWLAIATGALVLLTLNENYGRRGLRLSQALWQNTRQLWRDQVMRILMAKAAAVQIAFAIFALSWQLYAVRIAGIPRTLLGPSLALLILALAVGNALAVPAMDRISPILVSLIGTGIMGGGIALLATRPDMLGFGVGTALFEVGLGLDGGAFMSWTQDFIRSEHRTAYLSAISTARTATGVLATLVGAYFIQGAGYSAAWVIALVATVAAAAILLLFIRGPWRMRSYVLPG